jgi:hypothetical protein
MWIPGREQLLDELVVAVAHAESATISKLVEDQSSAIRLGHSGHLLSQRYSIESADYEVPSPFVDSTVMFSNRQLLVVEMELSGFNWRIIRAEFSDTCLKEQSKPGCDGAERTTWRDLSFTR